MHLSDLSTGDLTAVRDEQRRSYLELQARGLRLDLTRGKPSSEQLDLATELLALPGRDDYVGSAGDVRNYGGLSGLTEIRQIFADLVAVPVDQLVAGDNSSLALMHDTIAFAELFGTVGSPEPWAGRPVKFVCPVPGYDRHFALCEQFGIEMMPVPLHADGPDLDAVRALVREDPTVKGMWVVPTYANPTGAVYGEAAARELVSMPAAATDFRIWWDNAYAVHHLSDVETPAIDVLGLAAEAGQPNRVFVFASTSKVTLAGAGIAFFGSSPDNVRWYLQHLSKRTIGPDKVNHLRHARFLRDADGVRALMKAHRAILAPKFELVDQILSKRLGDLGVATWTEPHGGYFVSLDVLPGTAARVVALAKDAGIAMTGAGAAFPYGRDPQDRNIRIAPTFPPLEQVADAIDGLATCVVLAAAERLLDAS